MILKLEDGGIFEADSFQELAEGIWKSSKFDQSPTLNDYMKNYSKRAAEFDESIIEYTSAESFVRSIINANLGTFRD